MPLKNNLECSKYFEFFENEEYVKKFIIKNIEENNLYELSNLFDNVGLGWNFYDVIEYCKFTAEKTSEEIYEFFKRQFDKLIGYAWVEEDDSCSTFIIDELSSNGYYCVDRC